MDTSCDLLIVGAGPVGCVIAERAASLRGWRSLILERRGHVAGNCHDRPFENGVLVHQYGPHYFRTNDARLLDYLSEFTDWIPGNFEVRASYRGELYPIPINLVTLRKFFGRDFTTESAEAYLASLRENFPSPRNSEEYVLGRVGRELYEAFYLGYTKKQWDRHPSELDPSACGRIPVRLNEDCRYVDHAFQLTPARGFTELFRRMIDRPEIRVALGVDYRELRGTIRPRVATIYCGPVDEYFDFRFGKLPWRSLEFEFRKERGPFVQPCVQINYPWDRPYTRSVEIKHITGQEHPETVLSFEYSRSEGEPFYPVPSEEGRRLYRNYETLAQLETRLNSVHFVGRLATYRYLNTDEAIASALETFETLQRSSAPIADRTLDPGHARFSFGALQNLPD